MAHTEFHASPRPQAQANSLFVDHMVRIVAGDDLLGEDVGTQVLLTTMAASWSVAAARSSARAGSTDSMMRKAFFESSVRAVRSPSRQFQQRQMAPASSR